MIQLALTSRNVANGVTLLTLQTSTEERIVQMVCRSRSTLGERKGTVGFEQVEFHYDFRCVETIFDSTTQNHRETQPQTIM